MIDSVLIRRESSPPPKTALQKFRRQGDRAFYRAESGDYSPTLYHYHAPDGKHYLSAEVSLPKFLYKNNVQMLDEAGLHEALHSVGAFASEHFGIAFDPFTATVGRVDFCCNFAVGDDRIYQYLRAASEAEPAHLKCRIIGKIETVEYYNGSRKIYCYDKLRETERQFRKGKTTEQVVTAAEGILRLEARFNSTEAVKRLNSSQLKLPDIRAQTMLNFRVAKLVLTSAIESLGLHEPIITFDRRLDSLHQTYGYGSRFQRLTGFLQLCDVYGYDRVIALGVMKRSAYYKQRKELRDAGALVFSNYHATLPALSVR